MNTAPDISLRRERWKLTVRLVRVLERPMLWLSAVWSVLIILEFTRGLSPWLRTLSDIIWAAFVVQFLVEFATAPQKGMYLRKRWVTALSLAVPAIRLLRLARVIRFVRVARAARGVRLVRLLGTMNRGMRTLALGFKRRGLGYLMVLTALVVLTGAAGMYRFELDAPGGAGFPDYGTALWWTAMLLTTMGSDYWPRTGEGRLLCLLLALYAFAVFGYVTAAIAAYFVDRDKEARAA
ncbi:MAG: ion transporter [Acidobacteriota bacterium]